MNAIKQRGTTTVEFAIVGMLTLTLLFVVIEFGRILFSLNVLDESARRGARVAVICPVGDAAIGDAATFVGLPNLTTANIVTEYLDENGVPLGDPAASELAIKYVRVRIVNYSFPVALPLVATLFTAPEISSTLPKESLGRPYAGGLQAC